MAGATRDTATAPDDVDRWFLTHGIPAWRALIMAYPGHFPPDLVALARDGASDPRTVRRGDDVATEEAA